MHTRLALAAALWATLPLCAQEPVPTAQPRLWSAEASFSISYVQLHGVSPDGKWLLYTTYRPDVVNDSGTGGLYLLPTAGGEPKLLLRGGGNPRWAPDARSIALMAGAIYVLELDADGNRKEVRQVCARESSNAYLGWGDNVGNALCWSPDGKTLAFTAAGARRFEGADHASGLPGGADPLVIDRLLWKAPFGYSDQRRTHVWTVPAAGGDPKQITSGDFDHHSIDWSPDGRHITCISNRTGKADGDSNTDVCVIDLQNGNELTIQSRTPGPEYQPVFGRDAGVIACLSRTRGGRSRESDAELKHVEIRKTDGSASRQVSLPLERWCYPPQWSADGETLWFTADIEGKRLLYSSPTTGEPAHTIAFDANGQVTDFCLAPDGTVWLTWATATTAPEIYRWRPGQDSPAKVSDLQTELQRYAVLEPEMFTFAAKDGLEIQGWLVTRPEMDRSKRHPMVLDVHGGPHWQWGYNLTHIDKAHLLAAQDIPVLLINPRGSTGRGQDFSDGCLSDLGGADFQDLLSGIDAALEKWDFLDGDRIGITGVSYGGYMANWAVTQSDRFKAAVPISSISNLISQWGIGCNHLWFESDLEGKPWENWDLVWDRSPLKHVADTKAATLLLAGDKDFITPLEQSEQFFKALQRLGVTTELVIYKDEGHGIAYRPQNQLDSYRRTTDWFRRHL